MNTSIEDFQKNLLSWYHAHKRDLPWRRTRDPYAIWISEVMLQQTQVDTVIPYYERFLSTFPTIQSLAQAGEENLLKHWEGLGYYRRARHLHASAKEVVAQFEGSLPKDSKSLKQLKGFGPYTSASVASIAFGEPIACVDGNVKRVVSRLFANNQHIDEHAESLMFAQDPSSHNQAMMELGALICTPKNPQCRICPVSISCKAFGSHNIEAFPAKKEKTAVKHIHALAFCIQSKSGTFFRKRSSHEKWPGMWEFPLYEFENEALVNFDIAAQKLLNDFGFKAEQSHLVGKFKHVLTHRKIETQIYKITHWSGEFKGGEFFKDEATKNLPLSRLQQKATQTTSRVLDQLF